MRLQALSFLLIPLAGLAAAKPEKIRGVRDPIYHLYLQASARDATMVVLGPEASADTFNIGGTIQSTTTNLYLTIGSDSTSYKTLTWSNSSSTTAWGLEGDTIITTQTSSYGRQLNFLVCRLEGQYYQVYLQTGSATPAGKTCSNYQSLHLPCLC